VIVPVSRLGIKYDGVHRIFKQIEYLMLV